MSPILLIERAVTRLGLIGFILVVAYGLAAITAISARADGDESAKGYSYSQDTDRYQERPHRLRSYLSRAELRELERIRLRAERRREAARYERTVRKSRIVARRYYDDGPRRQVRYAEAPRRFRSDTEYSDGRECRAVIDVTGRERLGRSRATESANNAWRIEASNRHGFRFSNLDNAKGAVLDCNPTRTSLGAQIFACSVRARPCRRN
jgi:hypothetical protein